MAVDKGHVTNSRDELDECPHCRGEPPHATLVEDLRAALGATS